MKPDCSGPPFGSTTDDARKSPRRCTLPLGAASSVARSGDPEVSHAIFYTMFWFLDRGGERLKYEIRHDDEPGGYRVVVTAPDGKEFARRIEKPTELIEQSVAQLAKLRADGWHIG